MPPTTDTNTELTNPGIPFTAAILIDCTEPEHARDMLATAQALHCTWIRSKHIQSVTEYWDDAPTDRGDERLMGICGDTPPNAAPVIHSSHPAATRELTAAARYDDCDIVVIPSLAAVTTNTIDTITRHDTRVHAAAERVTIQPKLWDVNGEQRPDGVTDAAHDVLQRPTADRVKRGDLLDGVEWDGGRPPVGTTSTAGTLRPASNYDEVCDALHRAASSGMYNKADAAADIGCSRKTVDAALDRPELYGLTNE